MIARLWHGLAERGRTLRERRMPAMARESGRNAAFGTRRSLRRLPGTAHPRTLCGVAAARQTRFPAGTRHPVFDRCRTRLDAAIRALHCASRIRQPRSNCMQQPSRAARNCCAGSISRPAARPACCACAKMCSNCCPNIPVLGEVDADFEHLFHSWFNRGFLQLRPIDWHTPAVVLEKIIRYEAVHEISGWSDLRRRLDPPDRKCFAFFHPTLADDPLIFVEVALTAGHSGCHRPAAGRRPPADRHQVGAHRGVLFDLELPEGAERRVLRQLPDQAGRCGPEAQFPAAAQLRHAVAGTGICIMAETHASRCAGTAAPRTAGLACRSDCCCRTLRPRVAGSTGRLICSKPRTARADRLIRSPASTSATAPASNTCAGWAMSPKKACTTAPASW